MERNLSTAAVGTRKRRGEGHTRRDEILIAAKELFLREGYEATTIRRIADVVGVSAPALYLYFKDKEAIMLALCDQTFGFLIEQMDEIEKAGPAADRAAAPLRRGLYSLRARPIRASTGSPSCRATRPSRSRPARPQGRR